MWFVVQCLYNIDKYALFGKNNVIFETCLSKKMFYFNLKKLTFSWYRRLKYRKMDARFGFSWSGLQIKLHFLNFLVKKNILKKKYILGGFYKSTKKYIVMIDFNNKAVYLKQTYLVRHVTFEWKYKLKYQDKIWNTLKGTANKE